MSFIKDLEDKLSNLRSSFAAKKEERSKLSKQVVFIEDTMVEIKETERKLLEQLSKAKAATKISTRDMDQREQEINRLTKNLPVLLKKVEEQDKARAEKEQLNKAS